MKCSEVREIRDNYISTGMHNQEISNTNSAVAYAINVFGRDMELSTEYLADKVRNVREGMTIGEIAEALGFEKHTSLKVS